MSRTPWCWWVAHDLVLRLKIQPRAAQDEFAGVHDGRVRVRVAAPPVDGKANAQLIAFLAKQFSVPRRQIDLLHGVGGKSKIVRIITPKTIPKGLSIPVSKGVV